ncbi:flagellar basal body L-ring protein [Pseudobythopirellula maris]|uniref:Flagellar basal body L-ring protein n=1 Tax=Pseudobythopirellula maris TaxID=2527991 RepID=A0A5C5ZP60_9BACT|nr:flagellar basal body L-ring protein FlgH [Pseudobythopirellula maris]TWT88223.1 flagellar basal body L-ring protein [Pseudobythopirellula maris]
MIRNLLIGALLAPLLMTAADTSAQDSSLLLAPPPNSGYRDPMTGRPLDRSADPLALENCSYLYSTLPPEQTNRSLQKHDIITVLVDYRATMQSEGESETRKTGNFSSVLSDWIGFDGKSIFAAPQLRGDPSISGSVNSQLTAESEIEQRESLTFPIAAEVVDIRPNGNLVIEGHRTVRVNEEVWKTSVTGEVSRTAIGPDRVVRSDSLLHMAVDKQEMGAVRDGYARGWLSRWYGTYKAY